jgi:hypothetical protein
MLRRRLRKASFVGTLIAVLGALLFSSDCAGGALLGAMLGVLLGALRAVE